MSKLPVWKKEEILHQISGDEIFLKELIGDLAVLMNETRPMLISAIHKRDMTTAMSLSHTLKGSSGNLSAHEIYSLSKELEINCKSGGAQAPEILQQLENAMDRFLVEVKTQGYLD